jgi:two-component system sensor histidine kinase KdpD
VIVRIVDRGPGIPPAQLERVFEPFYRAGTAGGGHRGSGLGLAIARGFTESNAGSLHVESLPGQGATFVFELPLQAIGEGPGGDGAGPAEGVAREGVAAAGTLAQGPRVAAGEEPPLGGSNG